MNSTRLPVLASIVGALSLGVVNAPLRAGSCCEARTESAAAAATPAHALPDTSLYNDASTWHDQDDRAVRLRDFAGSPVIVSMVFSHCAYACPRIVADVRAIRDALPGDARGKVRIVLASFDSERDTPARLRAWAGEQNLGAGWTLLHGDADAVRELAVLLDIAYVRQPDGNFAHGNRIVLLDSRGVAVTSVDGLGAGPASIVRAATQVARSSD